MTVRGIDTIGNASKATTTFTVHRPLWFSTAGNTNPPGVGGTADDADIYLWSGTGMSRSIDVSTIANPLPSGANVDGFSRVDATHYYLSFTGNVIGARHPRDRRRRGRRVPQRHHVVTLLRRQRPRDDDEHRRHQRGRQRDVLLAHEQHGTHGWPVAATTRTSTAGPAARRTRTASLSTPRRSGSRATRTSTGSSGRARNDWLFSFSDNATRNVTGLGGGVQDEDVIRRTNGTWSFYFDGPTHGMTDNNLDVDAFDIP